MRTKSLGNNRYIHVCYLNSKSYAGEVKVKKAKKDNKKKRRRRDRIR